MCGGDCWCGEEPEIDQEQLDFVRAVSGKLSEEQREALRKMYLPEIPDPDKIGAYPTDVLPEQEGDCCGGGVCGIC